VLRRGGFFTLSTGYTRRRWETDGLRKGGVGLPIRLLAQGTAHTSQTGIPDSRAPRTRCKRKLFKHSFMSRPATMQQCCSAAVRNRFSCSNACIRALSMCSQQTCDIKDNNLGAA
jgi:hypothetical protein